MLEEMSATNVELAADLTIAWLRNQNNRVSADEVPAFLQTMYASVVELSGAGEATSSSTSAAEDAFTPAVSVRKSLASPDHILSMIDGKPYRTLRRHLAGHGLTPEEYRARYKLKPDYPMVAPSYAAERRAMAKKIGLGRKKPQVSEAATAKSTKSVLAPAPAPAAKRAARKKG